MISVQILNFLKSRKRYIRSNKAENASLKPKLPIWMIYILKIMLSNSYLENQIKINVS